jgi:hypothetical protein
MPSPHGILWIHFDATKFAEYILPIEQSSSSIFCQHGSSPLSNSIDCESSLPPSNVMRNLPSVVRKLGQDLRRKEVVQYPSVVVTIARKKPVKYALMFMFARKSVLGGFLSKEVMQVACQ